MRYVLEVRHGIVRIVGAIGYYRADGACRPSLQIHLNNCLKPPVKSRSNQADSNEVFNALQQMREEMRLLRDSVSFCSDKITDFQSDLTTLRERDRCESGSLQSDDGGVLIALKQGFHAAPQVNLQSEAGDLWISLDAKNGKKLYICCIQATL
ncbi:hypothetical protein JTB14_022287 [Gonioctena quinquepunctata]|nr:hypothetical protein JTB14_022287 [Gonioctena quinquepunctata]